MSKARRPLKTALLALLSATVLILALKGLQSVRRDSPESAYVVRCASNLRQIGIIINVYRQENGGHLPDSMATIMSLSDLPAAPLQCPGETANRHFTLGGLIGWEDPPPTTAYTYAGDGSIPHGDLAHIVMMFEVASNHQSRGGNVLYADGHVDFVPAAEIARLQAQQKADIRPVGPTATTRTAR